MLSLEEFEVTPLIGANADLARLKIIIEDATALAVAVAPCLATSTDPGVLSAARAILRQAVARRYETGSGITSQQTAGPFGVGTETRGSMRMFLPSEEEDLRRLCSDGKRVAFGVETVAPAVGTHRPWCSLMMGATYCSCGADLTLAEPLWEA